MKEKSVMKKYEVDLYDRNTGAESPIDIIEVPEGYEPTDYIADCDSNGALWWNTETIGVIFYEIKD